ncbi:zinc finger protein, putative [Plasmodium ovale]|uniref:Zinc finger protein, putative n=1 Tax=Plasmodium ovale TaxID=36330 RepID=A0A1D3KX23_PLAOA|nr:zinc finger protein, putative [Plasmodium ovale]
MDESLNFHSGKGFTKMYDVKNIYNIKKEDVIVKEYMNGNKNATINMDNNEQVNIYIENSDLNKKTYNCYTCNIQIYNYSFFRYHFKSEWHKYNLKRKLLNLNAVNELTFNEKLQSLKNPEEGKEGNSSAHKKHSNSSNKKKKEVELCSGKKVSNNNAAIQVTNATGTTVSRDTTGEIIADSAVDANGAVGTSNHSNSEVAKVKYASGEDVLLKKNVKYDNPLVCFFDNRIFTTIEENIKHMNDNYTFFIPDIKYVTNLKKIILTIGKKIYEENICIYCFRYSKCVKSIQSHMICKSHTKLHTDFFVFIEKYYDFSKTYVDLLNKYITNKDDKELLLQMLHKKEKKKIALKYQTTNESNEESIMEGERADPIKHFTNSEEGSTSIPDTHSCRENGENCTKENPILQSKSVDNSSGDNEYIHESDDSDDYKVKEEELSKDINYDTIYEVLEILGYSKPELNEYNNLILPDGSEAINRKLAYIFKQKLPLENRTNSKIDKIDIPKKKENNQQYRKYKYYIDVIKKYNLDLNVKTNSLNKFYKSDSIFFI